jgi:hypothetical protein
VTRCGPVGRGLLGSAVRRRVLVPSLVSSAVLIASEALGHRIVVMGWSFTGRLIFFVNASAKRLRS